MDFKTKNNRLAFSLLELMAVVAIVGIVTTLIVTRMVGSNESADIASCYVFKGDIEVQAEVWNHNTGSWPAGNLADIGGDLNYFPEGLPICPVDGTAYTIDTATGLVIGHSH